jgi:hypothetical protein
LTARPALDVARLLKWIEPYTDEEIAEREDVRAMTGHIESELVARCPASDNYRWLKTLAERERVAFRQGFEEARKACSASTDAWTPYKEWQDMGWSPIAKSVASQINRRIRLLRPPEAPP